MSQALSQPVKTFSIGFGQRGADELPFAREVAQAFHTEHYEEVVEADALSILPQLVDAFDEPFGDSSAIPTYLVSRLARQYVTMVLSGDGGDELFAGYERYQRYLLLSRLRWLFLGAVGTSAVAALLRAIGAASARLNRAAAALQRAALPPLARYTQLVGLYTPDLRREFRARSSRSGKKRCPLIQFVGYKL
jgi:asparagine synthase (glutamine-hydrolysing)